MNIPPTEEELQRVLTLAATTPDTRWKQEMRCRMVQEIRSLRKRLEPAEKLGWVVHRMFPIPAYIKRIGDDRYLIEHDLTHDGVQEFLQALHQFIGGCACENCVNEGREGKEP